MCLCCKLEEKKKEKKKRRGDMVNVTDCFSLQLTSDDQAQDFCKFWVSFLIENLYYCLL